MWFALIHFAPLFYIDLHNYLDVLCLLIKGQVLAWRRWECTRSDRYGLSIHGLYIFEDSYSHHDDLSRGLFPPSTPTEYERVTTPEKPRIGLPLRVRDARQFPAWEGEEEEYPPVVHLIPGVRFAETTAFQPADFIPCYSYGVGQLTPNSGDSRVRRNMIIAHQAPSPERDRHIAAWHQAAEERDLVAMYALAYLYSQALPVDREKMLHWYQKTAEQAEAAPVESDDVFENGSAAQCLLADLYQQGTLVPQDIYQALYWYRQSAAKGNFVAQYRLGMIYRQGQGVTKDEKEARAWFAKSAEQYYDPALKLLASWPGIDAAKKEK